MFANKLQLFVAVFFYFHAALFKKIWTCGTEKIGTNLSLRIWKCILFFHFQCSTLQCVVPPVIPSRLNTANRYLTSQSEKQVFCNFCIADHHWPPCDCFHHFPQANVLSSEAVILCELACGRDCLLVTIHHLSGRGDCMSDRVSGYWYDVWSERLVQGVN